jgi:hypothetical protein
MKGGSGLARLVGEAPAEAQAEPACFICNIDLIMIGWRSRFHRNETKSFKHIWESACYL